MTKDIPRKLEMIIEKVMSESIKNKDIIPSKSSTLAGMCEIRKKGNGYYTIFNIKNSVILFDDITFFDAALALSKAYTNRQFSMLKEILDLEERYARNLTNMEHYMVCYKNSIKKKELDRAMILEDKFYNAKDTIKSIRKKMKLFVNIR